MSAPSIRRPCAGYARMIRSSAIVCAAAVLIGLPWPVNAAEPGPSAEKQRQEEARKHAEEEKKRRKAAEAKKIEEQVKDPKDRAKVKDRTENADPWSFDRRIQPLLRAYCYDCHNAEKAKGDVDLRRDEHPTLIANNRRVWATALQVVRDGDMPPAKAKKQPSTDRKSTRLNS